MRMEDIQKASRSTKCYGIASPQLSFSQIIIPISRTRTIMMAAVTTRCLYILEKIRKIYQSGVGAGKKDK